MQLEDDTIGAEGSLPLAGAMSTVTTTPKYSMTSTWESVTKVMRTTMGLEGIAAEVGMVRTRDGEVENQRQASSH